MNPSLDPPTVACQRDRDIAACLAVIQGMHGYVVDGGMLPNGGVGTGTHPVVVPGTTKNDGHLTIQKAIRRLGKIFDTDSLWANRELARRRAAKVAKAAALPVPSFIMAASEPIVAPPVDSI